MDTRIAMVSVMRRGSDFLPYLAWKRQSTSIVSYRIVAADFRANTPRLDGFRRGGGSGGPARYPFDEDQARQAEQRCGDVGDHGAAAEIQHRSQQGPHGPAQGPHGSVGAHGHALGGA